MTLDTNTKDKPISEPISEPIDELNCVILVKNGKQLGLFKTKLHAFNPYVDGRKRKLYKSLKCSNVKHFERIEDSEIAKLNLNMDIVARHDIRDYEELPVELSISKTEQEKVDSLALKERLRVSRRKAELRAKIKMEQKARELDQKAEWDPNRDIDKELEGLSKLAGTIPKITLSPMAQLKVEHIKERQEKEKKKKDRIKNANKKRVEELKMFELEDFFDF